MLSIASREDLPGLGLHQTMRLPLVFAKQSVRVPLAQDPRRALLATV